MAAGVVDELAVHPQRARIYAEGWQSWSPTTWYSMADPPHRPEPGWQHAMRFRPGTPVHNTDVQGEGLLVVDPGTGAPARAYAAPDARAELATIHAERAGDRVLVRASGPIEVHHQAGGGQAALAAFGDRFRAAAGPGALRPAPRVWCSWYQYFLDVTAADITENLAAIERHDLPVDVVQIDDGWASGFGDGLRPTPGFPDMRGLVETIRSRGRRVGIWLAPFLVGVGSELATQHPDWLVGDAGHNWGQNLAGLDLTHPGVQELLRQRLTELAGWGVDYFKLDFLYAGAIPGRRHDDVTAIEAYRAGLGIIRQAVGPEAYLVGCGAPILPSVGLVDAMRVSPDTFHEDGQTGSTGLRGQMSLEARRWQHGRFWVNDSDCLVARPSFALREAWAEVVLANGGLRSVSDRIEDLDPWGLATTRRVLADVPAALPFPDAQPEPST